MPLYSYSRIGCFENCPRQYKFRYIEKPDIVKPAGVEAFMGTMVHETLEECHRLAKMGKVMSAEELMTFYKRRWAESLPENLLIVRKEMTAEDYLNLGIKALEKYHARHAPFDQEMTLGLEKRVVFSLDAEGQYKLQGYIDRLTRDNNGRLRIQDYKTSGTLPTQPEADADNQLALYQIAVNEMWPDNNGIELVWHYLQFDTILISHRTPEQLEELRRLYIDKIRRIERAHELDNFPPHESNLCDWCEYYALCPAKGGSGVVVDDRQETLLAANKDELPGLVDEYIACDRDKKELEDRQQQIRKALLDFCEVGSSNLFGGTGGGEIVISLNKIAKLPTKTADSTAVEKMLEAVREAGLRDEYTSLDVASLQKDFTDGSLPAELMEKLKVFENIIVQDRLRIKKK